MSDLKEKFENIISETVNNLKNNDDVEYVKNQLYSIYNLFVEELEKNSEDLIKKNNSFLVKMQDMEERICDLEDFIENIKHDIYEDCDCDDDCDCNEDCCCGEEFFEIMCPYCEEEIICDFSDGLKDEVICRKCNSVIELDWSDDDCSDDCCGCHGHCDDECDCDDCHCEDCNCSCEDEDM